MNRYIRFLGVELPNAEEFERHIYGVMAQQDWKYISSITKEH